MPIVTAGRPHGSPSTLDVVKSKIDAFERSMHDQKLALADAFALPETVLLELTQIPNASFANVPLEERRSFVIDSLYSHYLIEECARRVKKEMDAHAETSDEPFPLEQKALLHKVEEARQVLRKSAADRLLPEIAVLVIGRAASAQTEAELAGEMPFVMLRLSQVHDTLKERMPRGAADLLLSFPGVTKTEDAESMSLALAKWSREDRMFVQKELQKRFALKLPSNSGIQQNQ